MADTTGKCARENCWYIAQEGESYCCTRCQVRPPKTKKKHDDDCARVFCASTSSSKKRVPEAVLRDSSISDMPLGEFLQAPHSPTTEKPLMFGLCNRSMPAVLWQVHDKIKDYEHVLEAFEAYENIVSYFERHTQSGARPDTPAAKKAKAVEDIIQMQMQQSGESGEQLMHINPMILQPAEDWLVKLLDQALPSNDMHQQIQKKLKQFVGEQGTKPGRKRIRTDDEKWSRALEQQGCFLFDTIRIDYGFDLRCRCKCDRFLRGISVPK